MMQSFGEALREQRWDDHRYYHHSRGNQSLHLFSACCFLTSYVLLFIEPVLAVMVAWILAMVSRQIGHFFLEPKGYDEVNGASHEEKEAIKIGYNLKRKVILLSFWGLAALLLWYDPSLCGFFEEPDTVYGFLTNLSILWAVVAAIGLLFRTIHLFFLYDVQTGLVWFTKILTDPFHDVKIYHGSPGALLRGEKLDPMDPWPAAAGGRLRLPLPWRRGDAE